MVAQVNISICGWHNYFQNGNATKQLQQLDMYVYKQFERIFRRKYKDKMKKALEKLSGWYTSSKVELFFTRGTCGRGG
jgi:hypothetical protein